MNVLSDPNYTLYIMNQQMHERLLHAEQRRLALAARRTGRVRSLIARSLIDAGHALDPQV